MTTVYVLRLIKPFKGKRLYVFGSIAAIYDTIPIEQLGIRQRRLKEVEKICSKGEFENEKCNIIQSQVLRKGRKAVKKLCEEVKVTIFKFGK